MKRALILTVSVCLALYAHAGVTTHLTLDCRSGVRLVNTDVQDLVYDANWVTNGVTARILCDGQLLQSGSRGECQWNPPLGVHRLKLDVVDEGGAMTNVSTADFHVAKESLDDGWWYDLVNGNAVICRCLRSQAELLIPRSVDGYPVVGIGDAAFSSCLELARVEIPNGVSSIGADAFSGCYSLTRVDISSIADWSAIDFENTDANPLHAGAALYVGGVEVKDLVIPDGTAQVRSYAFVGGRFESVTISNGVTNVDATAFAGCQNITSVSVPATVNVASAFADSKTKISSVMITGSGAIPTSAYSGCANIRELTLECMIADEQLVMKNLLADIYNKLEGLFVHGEHTALPDGAFEGCDALSEIGLPESLEDFGDNDVREIGRRGGKSGLWIQDGWVLGYLGEAPAEVTIPEGVKGIASYAFEGQLGLERINLPESLKYVGVAAFRGCTSLETLELPDAVCAVERDAFRNCTWMQDLALSFSLTNVGAFAFANCTSLPDLTCPDGVQEIGEGAFSNCWQALSAALPHSLHAVGENAFWNCKNLRGVIVPANVMPMSELFPAAYDQLTTILIAEGETALCEGVFAGCASVERIDLSKEVETIPDAAFEGCSSLTGFVFPSAVTNIGARAFSGCEGLPRISLPTALASIGEEAFANLVKLEMVRIPDGVREIGDGAFAGCEKIRQVALPGTVTMLAAAFPDAYREIVRVEVPGDTTSLIAGLFDGCVALADFDVPKSLVEIGDRAFAECVSLASVDLPDSLMAIGAEAFSGLNLLELNVPGSVESIGDGAFAGCSLLRSVSLPGASGTLQNLFPDAYAALVSVRITDGTENINDGFFANCGSLKSVELPTSVKEIGSGAFRNCVSLAEVGIPSGVLSLGSGAFEGCSALASVTLPGGLSVLEDRVFAGCSLLTLLVIPEGVTSLGSHIFADCDVMKVVRFVGNAPAADADAYVGAPAGLTTQVATGSLGWDGIASSRALPEYWPAGTTFEISWWDPYRFAVTFDNNDGSGESEHIEEVTDTTYKFPADDPVRPGFAFLGWWTEPDNGARVTASMRVMRTSAHTLYAHWRPYTYTVSFDANGGIGEMESISPTIGETVSLPQSAYRFANHDFAGWALAPDGEVVYPDAAEVVDLTLDDGGSVVMYAVWTERTWTVADYLNATNLTFASEGDAEWFPDSETSHDGLGSVRSGVIGAAGEGCVVKTILKTTVAGNGTLSFWWKVVCEGPDPDFGDLYDYLELIVDGERPLSVTPIAGDVDWEKVEIPISGNVATHEIAWSFVKDDYDEEVLADTAWVDEVVWTPDPVTVSFADGGATEGTIPEAVVAAAGAEIVIPDRGTLSKGACKFVGWTDGVKIYMAGDRFVVPMTDVTLTAVWSDFTIADAVNDRELNIQTGADYPWTIDFATSHDGEASVRSAPVSDPAELSYLEVSVAGPGLLSFWMKADGLAYRGKPANAVQVSLDDEESAKFDVVDWTNIVIAVAEHGTHTIRWTYQHTRTQASGEDCVWLDEVVWTPASRYSITYELGGGVNAEFNPANYTSYDAFVLDAPTREGYDFVRWLPSGEVAGGTSGDLVFSAEWTPKIFKLMFDPNGGTVDAAEKSIEFNSKVDTLPLPSRKGWVFLGWYDEAGKRFPDDICSTNSVGDFVYDVLGNMTLSANWNTSLIIEDGVVTGYNADLPADLIIPDGVVEIGWGAFFGCQKLRSVVVSGGVTNIGWNAFSSCHQLQSVVVASSVKTISSSAFSACERLTSVTLSEGVEVVGYFAFSGCESLRRIDIPYSVVSIEQSAFEYCINLNEINVASGNQNYSSVNGFIYNKDKSILVMAPAATGKVALDDRVVQIASCAFSGCSELKEIILPSGVTNIGEQVFINCESLENVTLSDQLLYIGTEAFCGCISLKELIIPASVRYIDDNAFIENGLTKVTYLGNAPVVGDCLYFALDDDFCTYVTRGSSGWGGMGDKLPELWQDYPIRYVGDYMEIVVNDPNEQVVIPDGVNVEDVLFKIMSDGVNIRRYLNLPEPVVIGKDRVIDLSVAEVKSEIVAEILDVNRGAVIYFDNSEGSVNPVIVTAPTRKGLKYMLKEGTTIEEMLSDTDGEVRVGDGDVWMPTITVKGKSGFYSIKVFK